MANVPYNPVPTVEPTSGGSGATYGSVPEASPAAFGAQIGEAEQRLGQAGERVGNQALDMATEFARMATTAKAENDFASQYATGAAQLRQKFDALDDKDKIGGSVNYINGLNGLQKQFTGDDAQGSPYYKQMMSQLIGRHIFSETTGINKEVVDSTMRLGAQSKMAMIAANNGYASQNYDNPDVVDQMSQGNAGLRTLQVMDAGHDVASPEGSALLEETQRNDTGLMADGMVKAAVADGNIAAAMRIRGQFNDSIPGYQQLQMDGLIHTAGMQQFGTAGNAALAAGQPLPPVVAAPPATVQAMVANTAQTSGINPNDALTVARIESSMGTNVGSRGTIGQDKESAGKSLDAQAQALCNNWKAARDPAATALGREPEGWEQYTVYQQGGAGGTALLKADPNAKAVDILRPLYANPKDALSAITGNGGNATMSVSDFLDQEKQRWNNSAERAKCDFNGNSPPGDQILAAHQTPGATVQPAANPAQDYRNWQRANIQNMQQIMAMPSGPAREALLKENQFQTAKRETAASSYRSDLVNQASKLAQDPNFTSMQQVSPEMHASLLETSPNTLSYMEKRAEYNTNHQSGVTTEDQQKYGGGINTALNDIWSGKLSSPAELHAMVSNGQLTIAGNDRAIKELEGKGTPDGDASNQLRAQTYKAVRSMLAGKADSFGIPDPHAEETYGHAIALMTKAEEEAKANKVTPAEMYDPSSPKWIGNVAKPLVKTLDQRIAEIGGKQVAAPPLTDRKVDQVYQSPNGPVRWTGTGWIKVIPPAVPMAGVNE